MQNNLIHKTKWFWPWQDNKVEAWLEEMSRQGHHLKRLLAFGRYEFEKGAPQESIYRLDFQYDMKTKSREEYLRLFADDGWQHLGQRGGWQYFRKLAQAGKGREIFTDAEGKIQKYRRYQTNLTLIYPACLLLLIASWGSSPAWAMWLNVSGIAICLIATFLVSMRITQRIKELKLL